MQPEFSLILTLTLCLLKEAKPLCLIRGFKQVWEVIGGRKLSVPHTFSAQAENGVPVRTRLALDSHGRAPDVFTLFSE